MKKIKATRGPFENFTLLDVFWELNETADKLKKEALPMKEGSL
jgi:hypothetical protein